MMRLVLYDNEGHIVKEWRLGNDPKSDYNISKTMALAMVSAELLEAYEESV